MNAIDHPEYKAEKEYLDLTVAAIRDRTADVGQRYGSAADPYAEEIVRGILGAELHNLSAVELDPYFGRVDFHDEDGTDVEHFYIGRYGVHGKSMRDLLVIDWRAPVASLFYRKMAGEAEYRVGKRLYRGEVQLRRRYDIAHARLKDISDELDRRPGRPATLEMVITDPDAFLRDVLAGRKENRLRDIVTTIQGQQDGIIRAPHDQILLV